MSVVVCIVQGTKAADDDDFQDFQEAPRGGDDSFTDFQGETGSSFPATTAPQNRYNQHSVFKQGTSTGGPQPNVYTYCDSVSTFCWLKLDWMPGQLSVKWCLVVISFHDP